MDFGVLDCLTKSIITILSYVTLNQWGSLRFTQLIPARELRRRACPGKSLSLFRHRDFRPKHYLNHSLHQLEKSGFKFRFFVELTIENSGLKPSIPYAPCMVRIFTYKTG